MSLPARKSAHVLDLNASQTILHIQQTLKPRSNQYTIGEKYKYMILPLCYVHL